MRKAIIGLLLTASSGYATSYAQPKRHDVFSQNRAFVLDVNPETKLHIVFDAQDRSKHLWSLSFAVWHFPILLSDDGKVVALVEWRHIQADDLADAQAVTFWNKDGEFRAYPFRDICPDPPKTQDVGGGPIGDFWRTWYTNVKHAGESFSIRTTCNVEYRFRFADGELIERQDLGPQVPDVIIRQNWDAWAWVSGGAIVMLIVTFALWRWRASRQAQART